MKAIIIGAGKLGTKLAESMLHSDIEVTLVDDSVGVIDRLNDHLDLLTVHGNGLDIGMLQEIDIKSYDLLIATTDSDESNALICTLAKKLHCKKTIARIRNPQYMQHLEFIKEELGIDHIVSPELSTANEIRRYLLKNFNFYSGNFAEGKVQLVDILIPPQGEFIGQKIMDIKGLSNILIVAIHRNQRIIIPDGSTVIEEQDVIYVLGKSHDITEFTSRCKLNLQKVSVKRAMILGGGRIGYYLAKQLSKAHIEVSIIESDRERSKYLAENLKDVMVIHGDGTQVNLLDEEGLKNVDAFISVTGMDEQNLLMSLVAKRAGVPKTIAKISRPSFINLTNQLGNDVSISPVTIAASEILKYVRSGRVVSISLILGGQAEVTEVMVGENLPVVGVKISEIGLPKGIIIGTIVHKDQVIIPDGQTVIHANDRLIIFSLESNLPNLDIFLKAIKVGKMEHIGKKNQGIRKLLNS